MIAYFWIFSPSKKNFTLDVPLGERPPPATNLTLTQEAGGWVLRWEGPKEPDSKVLYYTIQKKKDTQGEEWKKLAEYIDVDEASYMSKSYQDKSYLTFCNDIQKIVVNEIEKTY